MVDEGGARQDMLLDSRELKAAYPQDHFCFSFSAYLEPHYSGRKGLAFRNQKHRKSCGFQVESFKVKDPYMFADPMINIQKQLLSIVCLRYLFSSQK